MSKQLWEIEQETARHRARRLDALETEVRHLRDDNTRLRAGLSAVAQIIHGSTRTTHAIAQRTLDGGDPRELQFFESIGGAK